MASVYCEAVLSSLDEYALAGGTSAKVRVLMKSP